MSASERYEMKIVDKLGLQCMSHCRLKGPKSKKIVKLQKKKKRRSKREHEQHAETSSWIITQNYCPFRNYEMIWRNYPILIKNQNGIQVQQFLITVEHIWRKSGLSREINSIYSNDNAHWVFRTGFFCFLFTGKLIGEIVISCLNSQIKQIAISVYMASKAMHGRKKKLLQYYQAGSYHNLKYSFDFVKIHAIWNYPITQSHTLGVFKISIFFIVFYSYHSYIMFSHLIKQWFC